MDNKPCLYLSKLIINNNIMDNKPCLYLSKMIINIMDNKPCLYLSKMIINNIILWIINHVCIYLK